MIPLKILIVDDLEANLVALEALLRADGVEVCAARSARAALELLLVHDFAFALLDVQMPEMDGFELAELMRGSERTRHVPIIFLTAGGREPTRLFQGYDSGAVDFLFKPIDPKILQHKARVFLELHRQRLILRDTLRLNEELVAIVGHDLRGPLSVILLTAENLVASRDPQTAKAGASLRSSGARMHRIIDDLLDLSRARLAGGIPIEPSRVDVDPLTRKVIRELQTTHPTRTINLRTEGDTLGEWDGSRLEQVGANLIGNALRHGAPGNGVDVALDGSEPRRRRAVRAQRRAHRARSRAAPLRALPAARRPAQSRRGARARPLHRPADRASARRRRRRRLHRDRRHDVPRLPPPPRRAAVTARRGRDASEVPGLYSSAFARNARLRS